MKRVSIFAARLVLGTGAVLAAGCAGDTGVWSIEGEDARLGGYAGTLEIRRGERGALELTRVVELASVTHADGRAVDLVWTGRLEPAPGSAGGTATARLELTRADFIPEVDGLARDEDDATPLAVVGSLTRDAAGGIAVEYSAADDVGFGAAESGRFEGLPAVEPIWRSGRELRPAFAETPFFAALKPTLFSLFESYHALPALKPYVALPAFQRALHYRVIERTDLDYYRVHPQRIRVVNKIVDAISLAETEIRADAFRASFAEKAAYHQAVMDGGLLAAHGMVLIGLGPNGEELPDVDANLWTGVYAGTQAIRYRHTGAPAALANLRRAVRAIVDSIDITGDPRRFARTFRDAGPPVTGDWVRGEGRFAHLDWLAGGNNDMSKGLMLGLAAGWSALPPGDPLRARIPSHARALLELCPFLPEGPAECEGANPLLPLPSLDTAFGRLFAGLTNDDPDLVEAGLEWLRDPLLDAYADLGGGPFFLFGISDWSGNHLTLATNMALVWALQRTGDAELERRWVDAAAQAWRALEGMERPVHAAQALALGALTEPAERAAAVDDVLWGLREFPAPKHPHPVDHSIRSNFVLSPWPNLPWKGDWETNPGRRQSLVAPALVESGLDKYRWKDALFDYDSGGNGAVLRAGVDYLVLYWLARDAGVIDATD